MIAPLSKKLHLTPFDPWWIVGAGWGLASLVLGVLVGYKIAELFALFAMVTRPQTFIQAWDQVGTTAWVLGGLTAAAAIFTFGVWLVNAITNALGRMFLPADNDDRL